MIRARAKDGHLISAWRRTEDALARNESFEHVELVDFTPVWTIMGDDALRQKLDDAGIEAIVIHSMRGSRVIFVQSIDLEYE